MREEAAQKQWGRQANNWLGTRVGCSTVPNADIFENLCFYKFSPLFYLVSERIYTITRFTSTVRGFHRSIILIMEVLATISTRENLEVKLVPLLSSPYYLPAWSPSCYVACWNRRRYEKTADQPWTEIVKHGRTKARERERIVSIGVG